MIFGPEADVDDPNDRCRACRWGGMPQYSGPHLAHFFAYGDANEYTGYCAGRAA